MKPICPRCNLPVPSNEASAYGGRHEDCYGFWAQMPGSNHQPSKGSLAVVRRDAGGGHRGEKKDFRN